MASKFAGQQVKINKSNNFDIEKNGGSGGLNSVTINFIIMSMKL